jgi:TetR/AcrR family transcriptional regulator, regulator of autoinduction and epiphytic fitness
VEAATPGSARIDGRTARAGRTHAALTDALLTLLDEGDLKPTAERIAARARVSERTLFKHFPDREALFEGAAQAQADRIAPLIQPLPPPQAPVRERVDALAAQRALVLERISPVRRAALLLEPSSETVAGWLRAVRDGAAVQVEQLFAPELESSGDRDELLAALVVAAAWPSWEALRSHQGLSREQAEAAMRRVLAALLGCD